MPNRSEEVGLSKASLCKRGERPQNQDYIATTKLKHLSCCIVCDGMGGHRGGEQAARIASKAAIDTFKKQRECSEAVIRACVEEAQVAIEAEQQKHSELQDMRTTLAMVMFDTNSRKAVWAHVGDSRIYYFKKRVLARRSKDHTIEQTELDAKQLRETQVRSFASRGSVYKSLGKQQEEEGMLLKDRDIVSVSFDAGDSFLLCSDGLWEYVYDQELEIELHKTRDPEDYLRRIESRRWTRVLELQKHRSDNYTAIAVFANGKTKR